MLVLLTRAAEDAARTRARLLDLGHRVLEAPLITVAPLAATWPGGTVDAVIATSRHAFAAQAPDWGPSREARRLLPLWLVGRQTAAAADQAGYRGPATVAANAVSLALQMRKNLVPRMLYLAGHHRKPDLETALAVTGACIEVVETYDMLPSDGLPDDVVGAITHGEVGVVLHYSRRSAELYVAATREKPTRASDPLHLCLSDDVATPLKACGLHASVAAEPTEDALFDRLVTAAT